jgi:nicotinamide-nucleotide amidase
MTAAEALAGLRSRGESLATAESLTGGMLGSEVTAVPGASDVYVGGVISYATAVKQALLGVPAELVASYGVVSAECAEAMALGARSLLGASWAISTTGVAGPDAQEGRPAGLVFVGIAGPDGGSSQRLHLTGDRQEIRRAACVAALDLLLGAVRTAR